ncbi:MAG: ribonuclease Y [Candidatus Kapaibacteriales bacterium]
MGETLILILSVAGFLVFGGIGYFLATRIGKQKETEAELKAKEILVNAEKEANQISKQKLDEVNNEWKAKRKEFEEDTQETKSALKVREKDINAREDGLEKRLQTILNKEKSLHKFDTDLQRRSKELSQEEDRMANKSSEFRAKLEQISGMTKEEATQKLLKELEYEVRRNGNHHIQKIRDEAKEKAKREAQNIIVAAIQRTASDHSMESTISVVSLESDEMKGRIIGREGRNIKAFESATGVDLIIDDTPEAVLISGFDPFRREIARIALEQLVHDGRIHPTRIEEVVEKAENELLEELPQMAENALMELDIHGMKKDLMKHVGRMKYRSSYGQNLLRHSIEVGHLCGIMAGQLGLDVKLAKRAGLLHDIGKIAPKEMEGPHALVGMELAKKFKEHPIVLNAIGAHHEDIEMTHPISVIVQAADSISGARPGARRESLENYTKRLEKLEEIGGDWPGVKKVFAIQAGRDLRVIVEPDKVNDMRADEMAELIAKRIEEEMEYPGQIKVTVIRERRSVGIAK